jgi:hypothetical protein
MTPEETINKLHTILFENRYACVDLVDAARKVLMEYKESNGNKNTQAQD